MKKIIGIDFGSSNTIIYVPKKGIIYNEPTVIAVDSFTGKVISTGYLAFKLLGKTHEETKVVRPLSKGVVADGPLAVKYLEAVLKDLHLLRQSKRATVIISRPSEITQIESTALRNVARKLGFKTTMYYSNAYLSALGCNQANATTKGCFMVNIGGGNTDMAVISSGEILLSKTCSFSGKQLDLTIIRHIRKNHQLIISEKTAEYIKMKIGSIESYPENRLLEVSGINVLSSLPHSVVISTSEIKSCITNCIDPLIDAIADCLELITPDVASDIIDSGIIICGGTAVLAGLREFLENKLNMSVRIAPDPTTSVSQGIKILAHQILNVK